MLSRTVECRAAIRAGNFTAADQLLGELRAEVEAAWPHAGPDQRETLAEEVLDLLKWARRAALVQRSHAHSQLLQLVRHSAYVPPGPDPISGSNSTASFPLLRPSETERPSVGDSTIASPPLT